MKPFKDWNISSYYGPEAVKFMLEELVSRKNKLEKMEHAKLWWSMFALFCAAVFFLFGYRVVNTHGTDYSANFLSALLGHPVLLILMLLLSISFIQLNHFVKKANKAEKEFDELREEFIARSTELWEMDATWEARDKVFSFMKQEHDINLYHK
ncbi:DUF2663 family protein [Halalkalibacter krulwichiae]|uniref:DUF2663 family protein n=1 Tax=Halalkalibacter krulwichiae TaxID=199441 RepID=A0A1X9MCF0_9BACI|nr:DUF2663 family protein [Halalkalibacter krulwichiae]ARK30270.1 hypothetical protein BkAM31D_10775 [Halalkalibacter krulwichiae]